MTDTLLTYAILALPSPLQAGTTARLTVVVSNSSRRLVQAESIAVTLPVGTTARALVADPAGIEVTVPKGWSADQTGGEFRFTPDTAEAGRIGAAGLAFGLAAVRVNDQPGTASVVIDETAGFAGDPPAMRSTDLPLAKFPKQFQVSELTADPLAVSAGGTVTLQWAGTPATYRVQYSPGYGPPVDVSVGNAGPLVSEPLARTPNVVFTLVVSVAVPGQDQPLVLQRQVSVDVRAIRIDRFDALPPVVPVNGVARLTWRTSNAVSAVLHPGNRAVEPNGSLYLVVSQTQSFTLVAVDAQGNTVSEQKSVTADPSLTVNAERFVFDGSPGRNGPDGANGSPGTGGVNGDPGGPAAGGVAPVAPLDLTGASTRVQGAFARGGEGGRGGRGGNSSRGPGGHGGRGGNAGPGGPLTVEFAAGTPGLLVVDVSAGRWGEGGEGGSGSPTGGRGDPGDPALPGSVTFADPRAARKAAASRVAARGDTLLGYALLAETEDGGPATLALSVSGAVNAVDSIAVPLRLLSKPDGWRAEAAGGVTTLTPPSGEAPAGAAFTFAAGAESLAIEVVEATGGQARIAAFPLAGPEAAR